MEGTGTVQEKRRTRWLGLVLMLGAALSEGACVTGGSDESTVESRTPVTAGVELSMVGEVVGKDGVSTEVPVVIAESRDTATIEIEGKKLTLPWNGEIADCACRSFANQDYLVFVRFPSPGNEGEVSVTNLADEATDSLTINGVLEEEDGLEIKIILVVAGDKESLRFHDEGVPQILTWDKKPQSCGCRNFKNDRYEALVHWPSHEDSEGSASLKRKASQ